MLALQYNSMSKIHVQMGLAPVAHHHSYFLCFGPWLDVMELRLRLKAETKHPSILL